MQKNTIAHKQTKFKRILVTIYYNLQAEKRL